MLKNIILHNTKSHLEIDPFGARIVQLNIEGVQLLAPVTRVDGKKAATHPCTPNFGKEEPNVYGLVQHGPARNALWQILESTNEHIIARYEIDHPSYPKGIVVTRSFGITANEFTLTVSHKNTGADCAPINFGEHCYWHTGIYGWDTLYINDSAVSPLVKTNATIPLQKENKIRLFDKGHEVILTQEGFPLAMLWAASSEEKFDTHYVCIEPIEGDPKTFWNTEKSMLHPGEERKLTLGITLAH